MNPRERELLEKLSQITEARLSNEQFGVSELAEAAGMSRSNLHRRVKAATGLSISQFIRKIRLEKAQELLRESPATISEIAFECGFHSVSYFTKCFNDEFGHPPGQARQGQDDASRQPGQDPAKPKQNEVKMRGPQLVAVAAASLVGLVVILILIIKPFETGNRQLEKSIAFLPIRLNTPDEQELYFLKGIREDIIDQLSKIGDLRVEPGISMERYRNTAKTAAEIAREVHVSYLIDGNGQKEGDHIRMSIRLLDAVNNRQIWSESYSCSEEETFAMLVDIPQNIAEQIQLTVTPVHKQKIESTRTTNLKAWELYYKGKDRLDYYWNSNLEDRPVAYEGSALEEAELLFTRALEEDSMFAQVYVSLAHVHLAKRDFESFKDQHPRSNVLDSCVKLADKALSIDDRNGAAHSSKGFFLLYNGQRDHAIEVLKHGIERDPGYWDTYINLGDAYAVEQPDSALFNYYRASTVYHGDRLEYIYLRIATVYNQFGFYALTGKYCQYILDLTQDTLEHYRNMIQVGAWEDRVAYAEKGIRLVPEDYGFRFHLAMGYMYTGRFEASLPYFELLRRDHWDEDNYWWHINMQRMAYVYWNLGDRDKAMELFRLRMDIARQASTDWRPAWRAHQYDLAAVQAFLGDRKNSLKTLRSIHDEVLSLDHQSALYYAQNLREDPLFMRLREDPEFRRMCSEAEVVYRSLRESIRKWLEENELS
jgi:AraC-like DNA-binding protein/TolB-like protein